MLKKIMVILMACCVISVCSMAQAIEGECEEATGQVVGEVCVDPLFENICQAIRDKQEIYSKAPKMTREEIESLAEAILWGWGEYGIRPSILLSIIETESNFNHHIISKHGAIGLTQVMPKYAKRALAQLNYRGDAKKILLTPDKNMRVAIVMLYNFRCATNSHRDTTYNIMLTAYNGGEVVANSFYKHHKNTVKSVYATHVWKKVAWYTQRNIV